jgi:opacity protein-like surface antigen
MFKRLLISSAVLAVTSSAALASGGYYNPPVAPAPEYFNGFYVGADISRDVSSISVDYSTALVTDVDVTLFPGFLTTDRNFLVNRSDSNIGLNGINGDIFIGYGRTWNNFYLGGEIYGFVSSNKGTANNVTFDDFDTVTVIDGIVFDTSGVDVAISNNLEVKIPYGAGISLMPGVKLNDSALLYGRVGFEWARIQVNQWGNVFFDDDGVGLAFLGTDFDAAAHIGNDNNNRGRGGFQLGVGLDVALNANWSIRGEYDHVWYSNFNNNFNHIARDFTFVIDDVVAVASVIDSNAHIKPQRDEFKLGVVYRFSA